MHVFCSVLSQLLCFTFFNFETCIFFYTERGNRMKNMKTRLEELTNNNKKLQEQEQLLRSKYDEVFNAHFAYFVFFCFDVVKRMY